MGEPNYSDREKGFIDRLLVLEKGQTDDAATITMLRTQLAEREAELQLAQAEARELAAVVPELQRRVEEFQAERDALAKSVTAKRVRMKNTHPLAETMIGDVIDIGELGLTVRFPSATQALAHIRHGDCDIIE